jgi:oligo-1,6-glucosidase
MDVINYISKVPSLPDAHSPTGDLYADGFEHYASGPRIHEFLQEMHREVFAGREDRCLTVGEMPGVTVDDARLFTDPARGEVDMVFQFEHVRLDQGVDKWDVQPLDLRDLKASLGRWQAGLDKVGWNSLYWDNHDQPRAVSRFGNDGEHRVESAKMLATVLHLHRGTPYVYQGEEIGMANFPFTSIEQFRDIESVNHYAHTAGAGLADPDVVLASLRHRSRDNARTPMQWDGSPNAGFTTGEPWLPVNPDHGEVNVAAQRDDPDSVLSHYKRLIALRHEDPVVVRGHFAMLLPQDERVYAFTRTLDGTALLVLGNFSADHVPAAVPDAALWARAEVVVGHEGAPGTDADPIVLAPWEGRVYRRR